MHPACSFASLRVGSPIRYVALSYHRYCWGPAEDLGDSSLNELGIDLDVSKAAAMYTKDEADGESFKETVQRKIQKKTRAKKAN